MIVEVPLNIQMSTSATINIEGALFEVGLNVQRVLPINLIR
tara:strand:- start:178 stop:300 length:123 start_codon:yes stop_codon:yes gene_type:complete